MLDSTGGHSEHITVEECVTPPSSRTEQTAQAIKNSRQTEGNKAKGDAEKNASVLNMEKYWGPGQGGR